MIESSLLSLLFSTLASIVATLTGLIGGFATFRLQRMYGKLHFLKDYILHTEVKDADTLNEKLREIEYKHIENIYLHNMNAVRLLQQIVDELDYHKHTKEYNYDIANIANYQLKYDKIRTHTKRDFFLSLSLVFVTLVLLVFTNAILPLSFLWLILIVVFILVGLVFHEFVIQVRNLNK